MGASSGMTERIRNAGKRLWSLVHGYDDIRGSRLDNAIPEGPTEAERAAARAMAQRPPEDPRDDAQEGAR